ncbi:lytic transglycosylase domain-containing protein [Lysinibacillus macroides]|uniref:Lytic transglycosylase n=1 Tax=Lysinibacillus macroides TaxID=33935 RepID=A0A0M9DKS4_9BACI|nr:lytic transglycosylase domain-containing protein [Lysinibacillus macroides]KOY82426.1 lytic transglycosylase [Lysinibacillus macroides]QPR66536.1 lytic transglycosylase domain-containing protein [Lysinibacillus macroides]
MDIQSLKSLLEIQALQTLGATSSSSTNSLTSNNTIFSDMIHEILGDASTANNAKLSSLLATGTTNYTDFSNQLGQLTSLSDQNTLESLLYKGSNAVFIPESVKQALANSHINTKLDSYVSGDVIGSTAYANTLAGANQYAAIIEKAAATYHVPAKLIAAVIKQESNFNPTVVSRAGAQGLMQLMPKTAQYLGVTNAFDPEQNIMAGANYLRQMLDKFNNDPTLALAAYNAGASRVTKYGGIPPFKETQNYVKKVMNYFTV